MPTEIDYARLAAFIDGEGCICICRTGRKHKLDVHVTNTNFILLNWCMQTFGGWTTPNKGKKQTEKRKALGYWRIYRRQAASLLRLCLPYFIIKREQAEVAIRFQETFQTMSIRGKRMKGVYFLPDEVLVAREAMRVCMRGLNRKGPLPPTGITGSVT